MDAKHLDRVQRRVLAEQALPDHRDQRGRNQDLGKAREFLLLDLPTRDPELDQRTDAGESARTTTSR